MRFTYAVPTILDEMTLEPMVYRDGKSVAEKPQTGFEDYWFTQPIGLLPMHYSLHSEVATIPITFKEKGVKECFFKISYWGMAIETVKKVNVLAEFGFARREPVEVGGKGALPTGVAPALTAIWLAEKRFEPGVHPPEAALDPEDFFKELEAHDIFTQVSVMHKI